jgi:hypothetical protein
MVEKFAAKDPSCIAYDEKLQFYSNLANEVCCLGHCLRPSYINFGSFSVMELFFFASVIL